MVGVDVLHAQTCKSTWGPDAETFDARRFLKLEQQTGRKYTTRSTSLSILNFGHGKRSCPGRFFAGVQIKLVLAHMLVNYDMRLDEEVDGKSKERNLWFGATSFINPRVRVLVRQRTS